MTRKPPPPKYVPRKTEPPRVIVGLDGVSRKIVYYVDGEVKSREVLDRPIQPCKNIPIYFKAGRPRRT